MIIEDEKEFDIVGFILRNRNAFLHEIMSYTRMLGDSYLAEKYTPQIAGIVVSKLETYKFTLRNGFKLLPDEPSKEKLGLFFHHTDLSREIVKNHTNHDILIMALDDAVMSFESLYNHLETLPKETITTAYQK